VEIDLGDRIPNAVDQAKSAIDRLDDSRLEGLRAQINELTGPLDAAREAARLATDGLTEFLTGDYENTVTQVIDATVLGLDDIQGQLKEAAELGGVDTEQGRRRLNQIAEGFDKQIANILQAGVADGSIVDQATASNALDPLRVAARELLGLGIEDGAKGIDQNTFDFIVSGINEALANDVFATNLEILSDAEAEVARIQAELNELNAELNVNLVFSPDQVREALLEVFGDEASFPSEAAILGAQGGRGGVFPPLSGPAERSPSALLEAQQTAARRAREGVPNPAAAAGGVTREGDTIYNLTVEQTIQSPTPIQAASESVRAFAAAAAGGGLLRQ
jgi:hypothetical protein